MIGVVPEQSMEKQIEKQMGCMTGFLQIFDRHQIVTGKRICATKRLPAVDSSTASETDSPTISREFEKKQQLPPRSMPSPERLKQSPVTEIRSPAPEPPSKPEAQANSKQPNPLPVFELKEGTKSSWKFCKEAPRLSLDSRATFDAKGSLKPREIRTNAAILSANRCNSGGEETDDNEKQRRSPSVIARLMGLEPLQNSDPEPAKTPELRRSASESRASRDLFQYRFIDGVNFQLKHSQQQQHAQNNNQSNNLARDNVAKDVKSNGGAVDPRGYNGLRNSRTEPAKVPQQRGMGQRKSYFDTADFFPETKQNASIYGEIEKRLRMRGIDEPSKDLETLKQILEALQLKGLLHHSKKPPLNVNQRNFVYDESPIVLMKPARSQSPRMNSPGRIGADSPPSSFRTRNGVRRESNQLSAETLSGMSPRRDRAETERNVRRGRNFNVSPSPNENTGSLKTPNGRRLSVETQMRIGNGNDPVEQRRVSPVQSPKLNSRRAGADHITSNRSPRLRKQATVEINQREEKVFVLPAELDESSAISERSLSTCSQTDTERSKMDDYKEGRHLLERCDKLLHSIAEITAPELQPSPVSVLDSSFYKEESSPSPVMKRRVDLKGPDQLTAADLEDDIWSPFESKSDESSDDSDFIYISDIIRASYYLPEDADVFLLLEKQQYLKGKDTSQVSRLQRRLVFDTVTEFLNRKRQLPPWKSENGQTQTTSLQQVWSQFQRIRERETSDDLFEVICGVLKKDLAGDAINGWGDSPIEMSEAVLDIERLIFKDLIGETIRDLVDSAGKGRCNNKVGLIPVLRRKLVF